MQPLGIVSREHMALLGGVQRVVDDVWAEIGDEDAGATGRKACRIESAKSSHPEFPIFSAVLASMPSVANGRILPVCSHIAAVRPLHSSSHLTICHIRHIHASRELSYAHHPPTL